MFIQPSLVRNDGVRYLRIETGHCPEAKCAKGVVQPSRADSGNKDRVVAIGAHCTKPTDFTEGGRVACVL